MDNEPAPANHPGHQSRPTLDTDSNAAGLVASSVPSSSSSQASSSLQLRWRPCQLVFCPYSRPTETEDKPRSLRVLVRKSLLAGLTKGIVETYQICNPQFMYVEELNPKRYLTSPSSRVLNDGNDNENSDLILSVNYALVNSEKHRSYVVKDVLGHGTFGQVAKCWFAESNSFVAVKIIKNQPAFYQQALVEVSILAALNTKYDPEDQNHIVRIYDYFVHQRHLCIAFELLDTNLYELIKINSFRGLSLKIVQLFSKQILLGLILMKDAGIIHCDLKPENILLCTRMDPVGVKIIDFGSACMEGRTVYSYIQSRYYRSPEVVLGYQYTTAIDMWSLGCIVAELYLGLPLFPGASEFDLLRRMIKILGGQPPDYILQEAKNTSKYFKSIGSVRFVENGGVTMDGRSAFQILTEAEYEVRELKKPAIGKEYFNYLDLEAIVRKFPYRKNLAQEDIAKESQIRLALIDFLRGLVEFDPAKRWSPSQASKHPFVTGEPFTCPYVPPPETPRMPVSQNVKIDHHPGGGHWFAAGLSPNIPGRGRAAHHHSPQYHMVPHAHPNSYGSLGSCGSYNDSGNSHGSYGDCSSMFAYFSPAAPPGMNRHPHGGVSIGTSPDARWRFVQQPHGNVLGVSPSAGSLGPLPFANSPLQFTPPNSCNHLSAGSPGHYGPTSPARSGCHGSPLAKMAASGQLNRRKSLGYGGNVQPLPQETSSLSPQQWKFTSGSPVDGNSQGFGSTSHLQSNPSLKQQQRGGLGIASSFPTAMWHVPGSSNSNFLHATGVARDKPGDGQVLLDPGDWDPNYSEELLLEEDCSDASSLAAEFSKGVAVNQDFVSAELFTGVGRYYHPNTSTRRTNGLVQAFSNPPFVHDVRVGHGQSISKPSHFMPHISQASLSRLGQQPFVQNHAVSEWHRTKIHSTSSGPRSPGSRSVSNVLPWGGRANAPPTCHRRRDSGRIA